MVLWLVDMAWEGCACLLIVVVSINCISALAVLAVSVPIAHSTFLPLPLTRCAGGGGRPLHPPAGPAGPPQRSHHRRCEGRRLAVSRHRTACSWYSIGLLSICGQIAGGNEVAGLPLSPSYWPRASKNRPVLLPLLGPRPHEGDEGVAGAPHLSAPQLRALAAAGGLAHLQARFLGVLGPCLGLMAHRA